MGAWGTGPFDNDSALDYLSDLAARYAQVNGDYDIVPGSVRADAVRDQLRAAMSDITDEEIAYVAAGLVVAALTGATPANTGTRLHDPAGNDLHLDAHCGYLALLDAEHAATLREDAKAALTALGTRTAWLHTWSRQPPLTTLAGLLD